VDPARADLDFRRLIIEYPGGPYSDLALFRLAQSAYAAGDSLAAVAYVARIAREYPTSATRRDAEAWLATAGPAPRVVPGHVPANAPPGLKARLDPEYQVPSDHVLVMFDETADRAERARVLTLVNGIVVGGIPFPQGSVIEGYYVVRIPSDGTIRPVLDATDVLTREASVVSAGPYTEPVPSSERQPLRPLPVSPEDSLRSTQDTAEAVTVSSPAPIAETAARGSFTVQLGAFSSEGRAEALLRRAADAGFEARLATVPGSPLIRVRVGVFDAQEGADAILRRLLDLGFTAVVARDAHRETLGGR
jgi:cell division septation protein DedD